MVVQQKKINKINKNFHEYYFNGSYSWLQIVLPLKMWLKFDWIAELRSQIDHLYSGQIVLSLTDHPKSHEVHQMLTERSPTVWNE